MRSIWRYLKTKNRTYRSLIWYLYEGKNEILYETMPISDQYTQKFVLLICNLQTSNHVITIKTTPWESQHGCTALPVSKEGNQCLQFKKTWKMIASYLIMRNWIKSSGVMLNVAKFKQLQDPNSQQHKIKKILTVLRTCHGLISNPLILPDTSFWLHLFSVKLVVFCV